MPVSSPSSIGIYLVQLTVAGAGRIHRMTMPT
ncbi:MAG: hypothetical protein BWY83_02463 [bacterium ADurb.Bin478]|nr:MAG: hypothetical protein BWY83_02463 [bacterium ADurb.Bin478]